MRVNVDGIGHQRGVALAILVWFIAAMSILVAGVVMQARVDIKLAQLHSGKARAEALADGAIQLVLAHARYLETQGEFFVRAQHLFQQPMGDYTVSVSLTPLSGLIDLNKAPEDLLFSVLLGAGNFDENVARELAISVVEWRTPGEGAEEEQEGMRHGRFEAIEDLLLVPGFDRDLYEALRDSVYVSQKSLATIDWLAAPVEVLQRLGMNEQEALEYAQLRREEDAVSLGLPESVEPSFFSDASLSVFRVDAIVTVDDTTVLRRRWVDRDRQGPDQLPWHFFHTEPVRATTKNLSADLVNREAPDAGL
jgi:hypothetical protein